MQAGIQTWFGIVGGLCLVLAIGLFARRLRVRLFGIVTWGQVSGHETREDDGSKFYLPVVVFIDDGGRERRFTSVAGGSSRSPAAGARVRVRYLPANPKLAYVDSFLQLWAAPLALALLGCAGLLATFKS